MNFVLEITRIGKSQDFWFADFFLEIFKIHRLVPVWIFQTIFGCLESVTSTFCLKLLLSLN